MKFPDPIDIHLHLPAGAQKKDGPSAGIAMVCWVLVIAKLVCSVADFICPRRVHLCLC